MWKNFFIGCIAISLFACGNPTSTENNSSEETTATETPAENQEQFFGEKINNDGSIAYGEMMSQMTGKDSLETKVRGTVSAVCQVKGCWMTIADQSGQEMRVRFKDYGFFMPKDIAGREVVFSGKAYREVTSVEDLRHYAEDDGKSAEEIAAITEPEEEINFLASGVILLDDKQ